MFSRGGKVVVTLKRVPSNHPQGPVAASAFHYIRLVFKNGGEDDVHIFLFKNMHKNILVL